MTLQSRCWVIFPRERKTVLLTKSNMQMFTQTLFTIVKHWKQSKCLATREWINIYCVSTQENTTQPLKIWIIIHAITCMKEVRNKSIQCLVSLYEILENNSQHKRQEKQKWFLQNRGEGRGQSVKNNRVTFWVM